MVRCREPIRLATFTDSAYSLAGYVSDRAVTARTFSFPNASTATFSKNVLSRPPEYATTTRSNLFRTFFNTAILRANDCSFCLNIAHSTARFTVLFAHSGEEALKIFSKEKPGLIFLDIKMLGMSGLDVLSKIKAQDKSVKVVMLTVMADTPTKLKAKELGADDFVTKPFMTEHLEEVARKEIGDFLREHQVQQPRILVVDDEEDVRVSLSNLIGRHFTCEVDKAGNGQEALEKLKGSKFDLVVVDIKMPGLSGIDVIREAMKFTPQTKFLAISAYDSDDIAGEAIKAGAVDFIHKPQTAEGVERKVRDILKKIGKYSPRNVK